MKNCTIVSCYCRSRPPPLSASLPSLWASSASSLSLPLFPVGKLPPIPLCFLASPIPCYFPAAPDPLLPQADPLPEYICLTLLAQPAFLLPHPCPQPAGRKPFPPHSTLFPLVTPCTHGDYFSWQKMSSCQRDRSDVAKGGEKGDGERGSERKRAPPETLRNEAGVHRSLEECRKQIIDLHLRIQTLTQKGAIKPLWSSSRMWEGAEGRGKEDAKVKGRLLRRFISNHFHVCIHHLHNLA